MDKLYPIIRRARRPLYPPENAAQTAPPATVEAPPLVLVVEAAPVEPVAAVDSVPVIAEAAASAPAATPAPAPVRSRKKGKHDREDVPTRPA